MKTETKQTRVMIWRDDCPESPRDWDNLGTMFCAHDRYSLGDHGAEHPAAVFADFDYWSAQPLDVVRRAILTLIRESAVIKQNFVWHCEEAQNRGGFYEDRHSLYADFLADELKQNPDDIGAIIGHLLPIVVLPLYLYDHGGLSINVGGFACPWDSGVVGAIYVTHETIKEEYGEVTSETIERARRCMIGEIETYDLYLQGAVYGFTVETAETCDHCGHTEWETVDSCGGFYGLDHEESGLIDHVGRETWDAAEIVETY